MKKRKCGKIPAIKKNLEAFIFEEEGAISKKDAFNLGLSIVMLGSVLADIATAAHTSNFSNTAAGGQHNSAGTLDAVPLPEGESHGSAFANVGNRGQHSSHSVHSVHSAHAAHTAHGAHTAHTAHGAHTAHTAHGAHAAATHCDLCCGPAPTPQCHSQSMPCTHSAASCHQSC